MIDNGVVGKIHSLQSLGAVDGPGLRFVVFTQGCPLRCKCCHNPDTWDFDGGKEISPREIFEKAKRYKEYFGTDGGITVTGGEPLLQVAFVKELFTLCKMDRINTCLDTSGCVLSTDVKELLKVTDHVLLDVKYTNEKDYIDNVGLEFNKVVDFLDYLTQNQIKTTIRQVIIPTINDDEENIKRLKEIVKGRSNVEKIELLPFRKICQVKYDNLKIEFPFAKIEEPSSEKIKELEKLLND